MHHTFLHGCQGSRPHNLEEHYLAQQRITLLVVRVAQREVVAWTGATRLQMIRPELVHARERLANIECKQNSANRMPETADPSDIQRPVLGSKFSASGVSTPIPTILIDVGVSLFVRGQC